jgi:ribosomal-protein-alanine N-acetyltransferase
MITLPTDLTLTIRPMLLEDLPAVQEIDRLSFSLPWPASSFRYELLENEHSQLWVAEVQYPGGQKTVVGAIVVWLVVDEAHIATLAVHPDYRQMGIGKRLLITALRGALQEGMQVATLEVRAGNRVAQALYQQFGFEVVGERHGYYQDNHEDALIMTLARIDEKTLSKLEQEMQKD